MQALGLVGTAVACALALTLAHASAALAASAPGVANLYTAQLTTSSVQLNAEVDPNSVETTYRFEYGLTTAYGTDAPAPDGSVGSGSSGVTASQQLTGLAANTLYHFRIVAQSSAGTTTSPDHTFVYQTAAPSGEGCPNPQFRLGPAASLPDCRAYERVSPTDVEPYYETSPELTGNLFGEGIKAYGQTFGSQSSVSGERILLYSPYGLAGSQSDGFFDLATREATGWSTRGIVPPQSNMANSVACSNAYFPLLTPEFTDWVFADGWAQGQQPNTVDEQNCGTDEPLLVAGEPQGVQNLFLYDPAANAYRLIDGVQEAPPGEPSGHAWAQGASADLSHVVFSDSARLTPGSPPIIAFPQEDFYAWSGGSPVPLTVLPGGAIEPGALANANVPTLHQGAGAEQFTHAVSADGSRAFFQAAGNLYVRENPTQPLHQQECEATSAACTLQLDARQGGTEEGGGAFRWASSDGSRVFFTDERRLTPTSTATAGKPDLYEYALSPEDGKPGALSDLTVDGSEPADVVGVTGAGQDGSYVYLVAQAALTGGQANSSGDVARPGQPNLYVRHAGLTTFIATLAPEESDDWSPASYLTARVSQDGQFIAFVSVGELTGFDNEGPCLKGNSSATVHCQEIYLYDAARGQLSCASCAPSGERPSGTAFIVPPIRSDGNLNEPAAGYMERYLSNSGQVFFNSEAELLPGDTNGLSNVYEYEHGRLYLLSDGGGQANAFFAEASADGEDVFFLASGLLGDTNGEIAMFDARVGGGFPEPSSPPPCGEATCAGPSSAPSLTTSPATATFSGPGNLAPHAPPSARPTTPAQLRAAKLAAALKACRVKVKGHKRRARCEAQARRRYGPVGKAKKARRAAHGAGSAAR